MWIHGADTLFDNKLENIDTYENLNSIHPEDRNLVMEAIACCVVSVCEYDIRCTFGLGRSDCHWVHKSNILLQTTDS